MPTLVGRALGPAGLGVWVLSLASGCGGDDVTGAVCRNVACRVDADCMSFERCVAGGCGASTACATPAASAGQDAACACDASEQCEHGGQCGVTATVGPRGAWKKLVISESGLDSSALGSVYETRTVEPSGVMEIVHEEYGQTMQRTGMLADSDLRALQALIDGPMLRAELYDGAECAFVFDAGVQLTLELSTRTLSQSITGCVNEPNTAHPELRALYAMLRAY